MRRFCYDAVVPFGPALSLMATPELINLVTELRARSDQAWDTLHFVSLDKDKSETRMRRRECGVQRTVCEEGCKAATASTRTPGRSRAALGLRHAGVQSGSDNDLSHRERTRAITTPLLATPVDLTYTR